MAEEPDRLRRDIEGTRATLTRDVDLLAAKTSPRQAAQRRWTAVKDRVMGTADQARYSTGEAAGTVKEKASELGDTVSEAPRAVARQTQGNPIAAGVIAFGVGMLAATLIPVTEAERQAGRQIRENTGELTDRLKEEAGELGSGIKADVQEAAAQVGETARDAAQTTKDEARSSAQEAAHETRQAAR